MSSEYKPVTNDEIEALQISFTGGDVSSTWIQRLIARIFSDRAFSRERIDRLEQSHSEIQYLRTSVSQAAGDRRAAIDAATKPLHAEIDLHKKRMAVLEEINVRLRKELDEAKAALHSKGATIASSVTNDLNRLSARVIALRDSLKQRRTRR